LEPDPKNSLKDLRLWIRIRKKINFGATPLGNPECFLQVENPNAWVFNGNYIIYSTQDIPSIDDVERIKIPGKTKERFLNIP
jgi:hypothetical protein